MYLRIAFLGAAILLQAACATIKVPEYAPSYDNVHLLASVRQPIGVDLFTRQADSVGKISLRADTLISSQGDNLNDYLQHALQSELEKAQLFSNDSPVRLSANIRENTMDADIEQGHGHIAAQFVVRKENKILYSKAIRVDETWDSSFIGAIAIPRAAAAYPALARKLLHQLFSDPDFIAALSTRT